MTTETSEPVSLWGRILAAGVVIGLGLLAALPYQKPTEPPVPYRRGSAEDGARLMLRNQDIILQVSSRMEESPAPSLPVRPASTSAVGDRSTTPLSESPQLPDLPMEYRSLLDPNSTQPNVKLSPAPGRVLGTTPAPTYREHLIVNGDTLERLAERYLGTATRASDILELNRDQLGDGTLLPINAIIKIPLREKSPVVNDADAPFSQP